MGIKDWLQSLFLTDEGEDYEDFPEIAEGEKPQDKADSKLVQLVEYQRDSPVIRLLDLSGGLKREELAQSLRRGEALIIDVSALDSDQVVRLDDYLAGSLDALGGQKKVLREDLFLLCPKNFKLEEESKETDK